MTSTKKFFFAIFTIIFLTGCSEPPSERANSIFVETNQMVGTVASTELMTVEQHREVVSSIEKILEDYPGTDIAARLTSGEAKISGMSYRDFLAFGEVLETRQKMYENPHLLAIDYALKGLDSRFRPSAFFRLQSLFYALEYSGKMEEAERVLAEVENISNEYAGASKVEEWVESFLFNAYVLTGNNEKVLHFVDKYKKHPEDSIYVNGVLIYNYVEALGLLGRSKDILDVISTAHLSISPEIGSVDERSGYKASLIRALLEHGYNDKALEFLDELTSSRALSSQTQYALSQALSVSVDYLDINISKSYFDKLDNASADDYSKMAFAYAKSGGLEKAESLIADISQINKRAESALIASRDLYFKDFKEEAWILANIVKNDVFDIKASRDKVYLVTGFASALHRHGYVDEAFENLNKIESSIGHLPGDVRLIIKDEANKDRVIFSIRSDRNAFDFFPRNKVNDWISADGNHAFSILKELSKINDLSSNHKAIYQLFLQI